MNGQGRLAAIIDLVLPATCVGCGTGRASTLCPACVEVLAAARPRATRPAPSPAGLPATSALGAYSGVLRGTILAYKERGRHTAAGMLGAHLATVVAHALPTVGPVLVVPVPATAAAVRRRNGDHMLRLARAAARTLRRRGLAARVVR
ncbi:MAG: ComF family protein, partial [Dactylosporangium sp.]|nr:ComF family protein [Dactylosporangium sp.]NNJ60128.1 ComF family protein [Dactylosporangium sp.]